MAPRRLGVALSTPAPVLIEIDGHLRALGLALLAGISLYFRFIRRKMSTAA